MSRPNHDNGRATPRAGSSWASQTRWAVLAAWATCAVLASGPSAAWANPKLPSAEQLLAYKPSQKGVSFSTPAAADAAKCTVEVVQAGKGSGYLVKDPRGLSLRKFVDTSGDRTVDQWSYYKDGVEVYREIDTTQKSNRADRFIWLHTGGSRIGADHDADGQIDAWLAISPEEVSQEALAALATKDFKRLQLLLVTEGDLTGLGTPAKEIDRIKNLQKEAEKKFRQTIGKLPNVGETTLWYSLESGAPSRLPADVTGMKHDVLMYYQTQIVCVTGEKRDVIQLGELVLVGEAWKLIDAPSADEGGVGPIAAENKELQDLYKRLSDLDKSAPQYKGIGADQAVAAYHMQRAQIIDQIIAKCPAADRTMWVRQMIDSYGTAAQAGEPKALERLNALAKQLAGVDGAEDLAAYADFRLISTEYSSQVVAVKNAEDMLKVQGEHARKLAGFVVRFPKSDDTGDALMQLATIYDVQNNDKDASKYYSQLLERFPNSPHRKKAEGAVRRIDLEKKNWELVGEVQAITNPPFSAKVVQGKVFVVYYWTSLSPTAGDDFARLGQLQKAHGIELVAINIDENIATAQAFLRKNTPPGHHLFCSGGHESAAAVHYGLMVFPHLFLVDKDGKVVNNHADVGGLDAELKKLLK